MLAESGNVTNKAVAGRVDRVQWAKRNTVSALARTDRYNAVSRVFGAALTALALLEQLLRCRTPSCASPHPPEASAAQQRDSLTFAEGQSG